MAAMAAMAGQRGFCDTGERLQRLSPTPRRSGCFVSSWCAACACERLFARLDAALSERGARAKGGQIVNATIVEARRPRPTQAEQDAVKGGGVSAG
jgi:hypothetical protein